MIRVSVSPPRRKGAVGGVARRRPDRPAPDSNLHPGSPEAAMTSHPRTSPLTPQAGRRLLHREPDEAPRHCRILIGSTARIPRASTDFRMRAFSRQLPPHVRGPHRQGQMLSAIRRRSRSGADRKAPSARSIGGQTLRRPERVTGREAGHEVIDHHAHMVSRTTDDYQQMALTGCVRDRAGVLPGGIGARRKAWTTTSAS